MRLSRSVALLLPALLAGCGDLSRPFAGNPGGAARRLVQPPPEEQTCTELVPPAMPYTMRLLLLTVSCATEAIPPETV